ncbi:LysR family transcriptional regulator [Actinomadura kijaniata]|uniref:LysR family transcriptional regulator n=1 Tax=Actinomadura kijaniata TaxID=46161 RepID=UPI00082CDC2B|nr:LysR family transcriptional regulator [Actinomadura kijaniata]
MLDVHRLMVLRSVVETGSIKAAAVHLGYTPSAVSQHVAALQRETGTALLERHGRGIRPTAAGRLLAEHARRVQADLAAAETALNDLRRGVSERLVVRYFSSAGAALVPPVVARFRKRFPGVRVELRVGKGLAMAADPDGAADAEIVLAADLAGMPPGLRAVPLLEDPFVAVLPPDHPLAGNATVELGALRGEPWVDNEWPPGNCREAMLRGCGAAGFTPDFVVEAHDYAAAVAFVAAGLGVTLVPGLALRAISTEGVVCRPVERPTPTRQVYVVVKDQPPRPELAAFLEILREMA